MAAVSITAIGILGSVAGVYALYRAIATERHKLFAYEIARGFPVATASSVGGDYELSIHFKAAGGDEERIEGAYLQFVRFANVGREAIYRRDNASANPLRIEISGARVLDIAIADVKRDVNQIELSTPSLSDAGGSAKIDFDFLDYKDGALVRVLTAGKPKKAEVFGDIIGMPGGIVCTSPDQKAGLPGWLGFSLWLTAQVSLFAVAAFVFHSVTNSWSDLWLLVLPVLAVVIPIIGALIVSESGSMFQRASWLRRAYPEFEMPGMFPFARYAFDVVPPLVETAASSQDHIGSP